MGDDVVCVGLKLLDSISEVTTQDNGTAPPLTMRACDDLKGCASLDWKNAARGCTDQFAVATRNHDCASRTLELGEQSQRLEERDEVKEPVLEHELDGGVERRDEHDSSGIEACRRLRHILWSTDNSPS
jgi:hypothetical protein